MSNPITLSAGLHQRLSALLRGQFRNFAPQGKLQTLILHVRATANAPQTMVAIEAEAQDIVNQATQLNPNLGPRITPVVSAIRQYNRLYDGLDMASRLQGQLAQMQSLQTPVTDPRYVSLEEEIRRLDWSNNLELLSAQRTNTVLVEIERSLQVSIPQLAQAFANVDAVAPIVPLQPAEHLDQQNLLLLRGWIDNLSVSHGQFRMPDMGSLGELAVAMNYLSQLVRNGAAQVPVTGRLSFNFLMPYIDDVSNAVHAATVVLRSSFQNQAQPFIGRFRAILTRNLGVVTQLDGSSETLTIENIFPVMRRIAFADSSFGQYHQALLLDPNFEVVQGANADGMMAEIFIAARELSTLLTELAAAFQAYVVAQGIPQVQGPPWRDDDSDRDGTGGGTQPLVVIDDTPPPRPQPVRVAPPPPRHESLTRPLVPSRGPRNPDSNLFDERHLEYRPIVRDSSDRAEVTSLDGTRRRGRLSRTLGRVRAGLVSGWNSMKDLTERTSSRSGMTRSHSMPNIFPDRDEGPEFTVTEEFDWSRVVPAPEPIPAPMSDPSAAPGSKKKRKIRLKLPFSKSKDKDKEKDKAAQVALVPKDSRTNQSDDSDDEDPSTSTGQRKPRYRK